MRLLRHGQAGTEKPGLLDNAGRIRDLSDVVQDINPAALHRLTAGELRSLKAEELPIVEPSVRLGPPVAGVGKLIAIGLNYRDHAKEANLPIPTEPIIFLKATSSICGPDDQIVIPRGSVKTDWEIELGVVIGAPCSYVDEKKALEHVAGYLLANDVSEREYQLERGGTWDKGKSCDTFAPLGPWLVTPEDVGDVQNLDMWLNVNGERRQTGNTATMIFDVRSIIAYVSRFMSLQQGDIIITGTPPGVGMGMRPNPQYLHAGDVVELGIQGLGQQRQRCVGAPTNA
jgi:2,4-diketo-3-deoxy-L-fuconate hydrolase